MTDATTDIAVAYTCPFVPAEWIAAHGLRAVRVIPATCEPGPLGLLSGLCPYALAFVNHLLRGGGWQAAIFSTVCDQMRRAAEWLSRQDARPVFLLDVPSTWQTPAAFRLYLDELRRLGRFLESLGGRAPSAPALAETVGRFDEARLALRAAAGRLRARAWAEAAGCFHAGGELPADLPAAPLPEPPSVHGRTVAPAPGASGGAAARCAGVPLAVLGESLVGQFREVYDMLEAAGGRVVLDATCAGELALPPPVDRRRLHDSEPLTLLAEAYFGGIPHPARRPNSLLYQWLKRALADSGARAVVLVRYLWCDLWGAEAARLRQWSGRPVLELDMGDEDGSPGRLAGRIAALLETLR